MSIARLALACILVAFLSSCNKPAGVPDAASIAAALPPPYAFRGEDPPGGRLEPGRDGERLYRMRCGACHLAFGMGTNMLTAQRVALGEPPGNGLLENRDDLRADYIRTVVRTGKVAMPRLSRVEVTDAELDAIAAWLAGPK
jgi:mono/diheme cytochrome c family protein